LTSKQLRSKIKNSVQVIALIAFGLAIGIGAQKAYGWYMAPPAYITVDASAHFENTAESVVIYTTSWCPFCKKAKAYLTANNIEFIERDIEQGDERIKKLYQSIGLKGVPKIVIGDKAINGFNLPLVEQELVAQKLMSKSS